MRKKLIALGLSLALATACVAPVGNFDTVQAAGENTATVDGVVWNFTLVYRGGNPIAEGVYTNSNKSNVVVPESIDGASVVSIGGGIDAAFPNGVVKVSLPDSVVGIKANAFRGITSLKEINLNRIESFGSSAFQNCTGLEKINLKRAVVIEKNAFSRCTKLSSIAIPEGCSSIGIGAFAQCTGLQNLQLEANVDYEKVFTVTRGLKSLVVGESVQSISADAFNADGELQGSDFDGELDVWLKNRDTKIGYREWTTNDNSVGEPTIIKLNSGSSYQKKHTKGTDSVEYSYPVGSISVQKLNSTHKGKIFLVGGTRQDQDFSKYRFSTVALNTDNVGVVYKSAAGTEEFTGRYKSYSLSISGENSWEGSLSGIAGKDIISTYSMESDIDDDYSVTDTFSEKLSTGSLESIPSMSEWSDGSLLSSITFHVENGSNHNDSPGYLYVDQITGSSAEGLFGSVSFENSANEIIPDYRPDDEVSYIDANGERQSAVIRDDGSFSLPIPSDRRDMENNGWHFEGWNTDRGAITSIDRVDTSQGGDVTLYPIYTKTTTVIRLMGYDGIRDYSQKINSYNQDRISVVLPDLPSVNGAIGVGWSEGTTPSSSLVQRQYTTSIVGGPRTLYGIYCKSQGYRVHYVSSVAADLPGDQYAGLLINAANWDVTERLEGISVATHPSNPAGYRFNHWDMEGRVVADEQEISLTHDIEIEAVWDANRYTFTYHANGGVGISHSQDFRYGIAQRLEANWFTPPVGMVFGGWTTEPDGDVVLQDEEEVTTFTPENEAVVNLYAVWLPDDYKLTFDFSTNGGTSATVNNITVKYNSVVDLTKYLAEKQGEVFIGWALTPNASNVITDYRIPAENKRLYAIFGKETKITFHSDSDTDKRVIKTYNSENSVSVEKEAVTKPGWEFVGWTAEKTANSNTTWVPAGNIVAKAREDTDLYALYKKDCTLTKVVTDERKTKYNEYEVLTSWYNSYGVENLAQYTLESKTRDGWQFKGWLKNRVDWDVDYQEGDTIVVDEDTSIWAEFSEATTLQYDAGEYGSIPSETKELLIRGDEELLPEFTAADLTRTGWQLTGWVLGDNTIGSGNTITLERSSTVSAAWTPNRYTIHFESGKQKLDDVNAEWGKDVVLPGCNGTESFTVTFDPDGGRCEKASISLNGTFEKWVILGKEYFAGDKVRDLVESGTVTAQSKWALGSIKLQTATKDGSVFQAWTDGEKLYKAGDVFTPTYNTTLTAMWEIVESEVSIDWDGATTNGSNSSLTLIKGLKVSYEGTVPKKVFKVTLDYGTFEKKAVAEAVYKYTGLWSEKGGKGTQYFDATGKAVKAWDKTDKKVTLYAGWESSSIMLPEKTYTGYATKGYKDASGNVNIPGTKVTPTKDCTYSLVVEAKEYTVKFNLNGGNMKQNSLTYKYGSETVLPVPERNGYYFAGWVSSDKQVIRVISSTSAANYTLDATWTKLEEGSQIAGNTDLKTLTLPNGMTAVPDGYMAGCTNLESVVIPAGITSLGKDALKGCIALTELVLPDGLLNIGENALAGCRALEELKIPSSVRSVSAGAFNGCSSLKALSFSDQLVSLDLSALTGCNSLQTLRIENPNCTLTGSVKLPKGTVLEGYDPSTLKDWAIQNGYEFKSIGEAYTISISDSVSDVEDKAYYLNWLPKELKVLSRIGLIKDRELLGYKITTDTAEFTSGSILYDANGYLLITNGKSKGDFALEASWSGGSSNGSKKVTSKTSGGVTYKLNGSSVMVTKINAKSKITIVDSIKLGYKKSTVDGITVTTGGTNYKVKSVSANAAKGNKKLKAVVVPASVKSIGVKAFYNCQKLNSIMLKGKTTIAKGALTGTKKGIKIVCGKNYKNYYKKQLKASGANGYKLTAK